ncbi:TB2/DP1, HVA22 family [Ancylostoma ceylanicum]|uniref:Receptor expression-enhancing protein n=1 Tax=Ancylostoma ceylanicum TaxID=53326 RepID=A0A0D6LTD8_9BILA|nr:TB2/DP1, HVA22 family [Ancylostoma ceylanicum]
MGTAVATNDQSLEQLQNQARGMATQLQQAYDVIQKKLQPVTDQMYDKDKNKTVEKILAAAEEKTNIKREKLVYGALAGLLIYFIIGALAQILSNIVGFAYPAYRSIKAVRSPIKEDDTQWLIYWIVFASFSIIDFSIFSTVPFYWLFKVRSFHILSHELIHVLF